MGRRDRYLLEDVPSGRVFYETLARVAGAPVPNLSSAITLLSSAYGRDFRRDNPLLDEMTIDGMKPAALLERCAGQAR
jgi:opine dehydrogenase